jgi:branched-chain amino acid transport system permease protein
MTNWYTVAMLAGIYGIAAIAMQLGMMAGTLSLAVVGWMGVGGYFDGLATTKWGWNPLLAIVVAMVAAAFLGHLVVLPAKRVQGLYYSIITLTFVLALQVVFGSISYLGGEDGIYAIALWSNGWRVFLGVVVTAAAAIWLSTGRRGRSLRASGQDDLAARALGVNVIGQQMLLGRVSAVLGVLAGGLYAGFIGYVSPDDFGFTLVVSILVMVVVGGRRSWLGALIGAVLMTVISSGFNSLVGWALVIEGAFLLVTMAVFPAGVIGLLAWAGARWQPRLRMPAPISAYVAGHRSDHA